jgi:hypothetical protein
MLACMIPPGAIGPGVRHLWPRSRYRRARGVWSHSTLTKREQHCRAETTTILRDCTYVKIIHASHRCQPPVGRSSPAQFHSPKPTSFLIAFSFACHSGSSRKPDHAFVFSKHDMVVWQPLAKRRVSGNPKRWVSGNPPNGGCLATPPGPRLARHNTRFAFS